MAVSINLPLILGFVFVHYSTVIFGEKPCEEGSVCAPLSRCTATFDGVLFPCHDGLRYVCCPSESSNYTQTNVETRKRDLFPEECGVTDDPDRISGGERANIGQFPWMALLGYKQKSIDFLQFLCGGSIITEKYILTAAHCLFLGRSIELVVARLGELDLTTNVDCIQLGPTKVCGEPHVDILVNKATPHENYNEKNYKNDIGLVKLEHPVRFTESIRPICLPFERNIENQNLVNQNFTISGWGKIRSDALGGSQYLLFTFVSMWDLEECNDSVPPQVKPIKQTQICASGKKKEDACKGDSGGPLFNVTRDPDGAYRNFQLGIVSFSSTLTCGNPKLPTVYTRVDKYLDWIVDNVS